MPSKKLRLTVYLSSEEHAHVSEYAARAGLSLSTFAKRVCTGTAVPSLEHSQAVRDILKANGIDRTLSAKRLQDRFGEYRPYQGLREIQELSRYQAAPLHRSPERGELAAKYKTGIETRKTKLEAVKEQERATLAAIRQQWTEKRKEIEHMNIAKRNRRNLLALAKKREAEALAKTRLDYLPERKAVSMEIPYASWQHFLKLEAENGNEVALAVLRSRNESVESENTQEPPKAPAKDWSRHDLDYAVKTAIMAEFAQKEQELQERPGQSVNGKKGLQAFLRMEQIAAEANAEGAELGEVKRHIDGKGVVVFTMDSGGTVRDTGKEIFFSGHDPKAERTAMLYAAKKWSKHITVEKGHIIFQPGREQEQHALQQELSSRRQSLSR